MTLKRLLHISRPALWIYLAGAYAVGVGNIHNFSLIAWIELLLFTLPFNFLLYGINDIYDRKTDALNPRKGHKQGAILRQTEVKPVIIVSLIFATVMLVVAALPGNAEHFLIMVFAVLAVFAYSHSKIRLKEIPILDGIIGGGCYLIPAALGYTLHASFASVPLWIFFLVVPMAGAHAVTTLMDIESDRAAGLKTTGVVLGEKMTILWGVLTFAVGLVILAKHAFFTGLLGANLAVLIMTYMMKRDDPNRFWFYFTVSAMFGVCWLMALIYYFLLANRFDFGLVY